MAGPPPGAGPGDRGAVRRLPIRGRSCSKMPSRQPRPSRPRRWASWCRARLPRSKRNGSAAVSAVERVPTAEPGNPLAEILQRLGQDEAKALADELVALWRGDSTLGDRAAARLAGIFREVGLVTREQLDEAELKIAQLEHRLRLLENERSPAPPAP